MEFIFSCVSKLHKDEHNSKMAYIIETEIEKWLELLVDSVDMFASNAVEYFKMLYTELSPRELHIKFGNVVVHSVSYRFIHHMPMVTCAIQFHFQIQTCGMEFLKKHFSVSQFYVLFKPLNLWHFQVCFQLYLLNGLLCTYFCLVIVCRRIFK